jgi:hypothetical protein
MPNISEPEKEIKMVTTYEITEFDLSHAKKLMSTGDGLPWVVVYIRIANQHCERCCKAKAQQDAAIKVCTHFPSGCNIAVISNIGFPRKMTYRTESGRVRPELAFIAELIEQGFISGVCVYDCTLIGRSQKVILDFLELVRANNIEFISLTSLPFPRINVNEPCDTADKDPNTTLPMAE